MTTMPNKSPEPTAVGVPRLRDSAVAVHVAVAQLFRRLH